MLTSISVLAVSGAGIVAAAILGRTFGRNASTDGFLAAYGVYLVLALAAQAFRSLVIPELTRAEESSNLAGEVGRYGLTFALAGALLGAGVFVLAAPIGHLLTGSLPAPAAETAAGAVLWLVPAAILQLLAGLFSSALAATGSYLPSAVGYAAGASAGVVLFVALIGNGLIALAWGTLLNGFLAALVPCLVLVARRGFPVRAWQRLDALRRLRRLLGGASVPLAAQLLYLLCLRATADLVVGSTSSFSYAYLLSAVMVATTAGSLALVSAQPFTDAGRGTDQVPGHVARLAWLCLVPIAAGTGVAALAGRQIFALVLGDSYGGGAGRDLGLLVLALAPWAFGATLYTLLYPLVFVFERGRRLPLLAVGALAVHALLLVSLFLIPHLAGVALVAAVLAVSTLFLAFGLVFLIGPDLPAETARQTVSVALLVGLVAGACFLPWTLLSNGLLGALGGLLTLAVVLGAWRPAGLREAWVYALRLR